MRLWWLVLVSMHCLACGKVSSVEKDSAIQLQDTGPIDGSILDAGIVQQWHHETYIKAPNSGPGDQFGSVVSISRSGQYLAIAAPFEDSDSTGIDGPRNDGKQSSGAVYLYERIENSWAFQSFIKATNTDTGDRFGHAMALNDDGTVLAVSAPYEDGDVDDVQSNDIEDSGAVYIYNRIGNNWIPGSRIKANQPITGANFGSALSMNSSGDTIAIGAPFDMDDNITGKTYIAKPVLGTWSIVQSLSPQQGNNDDRFGLAVELSKNGMTLAVSSPYEDNAGAETNSGSVYIYSYSSESSLWIYNHLIRVEGNNTGDRFGESMSLSFNGDKILIGAALEDGMARGVNQPMDDNDGMTSGAAFLFVKEENEWRQTDYFKSSNSDPADQFGLRVLMNGNADRIFVGAFGESSSFPHDSDSTEAKNDNNLLQSGALYGFEYRRDEWSEEHYIKATNPGESDIFGASSLSLTDDGQLLVVGAKRERSDATGINGDQTNQNYVSAGAVYVYRLGE